MAFTLSIIHVKVQVRAPVAANVIAADSSASKTPPCLAVCCSVAEFRIPVDEGRSKFKFLQTGFFTNRHQFSAALICISVIHFNDLLWVNTDKLA